MARLKQKKQKWEVMVLKVLLGLYIVLCLVIAGLNYGVAPGASAKTAKLIQGIWQFYENIFKTFLIVIGSWMTLRITGKRSKMQRRNFLGFILAAMFIHILGPLLTGNADLYFFGMPFPWSTTGLQIAVRESTFYARHLPSWGIAGISASLFVYGLVTIIVFTGTILFGRRWQCSTLCLFNGFISETFSPAYPLIGKKKSGSGKGVRILIFLKWALLLAGLFFFLYWSYVLLTGDYRSSLADLLARIEVYKYLTVELLMAMFLWVIFTGRGYCYYCPLGTVLSWVSRLAGQKIRTDRSQCIGCGKCNTVCPMGIEIQVHADRKESVIDGLCVGCGHCIDICPVETLEYSTSFLEYMRKVK
jgi:ferredoxin-type protein NapH